MQGLSHWKKTIHILIIAHYCASFSVRLLIALNMLSWVRPHLRREYANYKNGLLHQCPIQLANLLQVILFVLTSCCKLQHWTVHLNWITPLKSTPWRFLKSVPQGDWKFSITYLQCDFEIRFITERVSTLCSGAKWAYPLGIHTPPVLHVDVSQIFHRGCVKCKWSCPFYLVYAHFEFHLFTVWKNIRDFFELQFQIHCESYDIRWNNQLFLHYIFIECAMNSQQRVFMWHQITPILQVIILMTTMLVSSLHSMVLENTTKCYYFFYLVHTTIPNYEWQEYQHTHSVKILNTSMKWISSSPVFYSIPCFTKRKPRDVAKLCVYKCVPRCANPLYTSQGKVIIWQNIKTYLIKFVYLSNEEITITTGYLGVCYMDHILKEQREILL